MKILYEDEQIRICEVKYSDGNSGMSMTFGQSTQFQLFEKYQNKFLFFKWKSLKFLNYWDVSYFKKHFGYKYNNGNIIQVILTWYNKK